jgi:cellulose synthase (UDP-forming)
MSFDLLSLRFFLVVGIFWLLVAPSLSKDRNSHRTVVTIFTALVGVRYLLWRLFVTVIPFKGGNLENFWVILVYVVEVLAFIEICIFLLIMSKKNSRNEDADHYEKDLFRHPSVDIFIPTYNEGLDVLEKTVIGAKNLDYPNFKVWVLDDGRRDWLKDFCGKEGVEYLTRPDNFHAKAGNLNNGLAHSSGELFAIFDADFVPAKNFLSRTVGFFIHEEDVGIVQTPQHFFNRDPIQSNLYMNQIWTDEQRLFFDAIAPCRDGWGAAFCCGSCSIARRKAVDAVGGIPTSSITEDILTTLCLLTVHYRTVYLNEKLSQGMAADSLKGYFIQRGRWCRGGIQCFFVPEGPLRAKGLTFLQRVLFAPYGWIIQPVVRFMLLIVPIIYLWLGITPLHMVSTEKLISYQFPMFLAFMLAMKWLVGQKYVPIISTTVGIFGMFRLLPVVISSLIKPFGEPFRVTPKGSGSHSGVDWGILTACSILTVITLSGIIINLVPEYRILSTMEFFPYALLWSCLNVIILLICFLICFDVPRKRKEERFVVGEDTIFDGKKIIIDDMSLSGCRMRHFEKKRMVERGDILKIEIPDVSEPLEMEVKNSNAEFFMCAFCNLTSKQREELIVKLFTGRYDNEVHEAENIYKIVWSLIVKRAFGGEMK